MTNKEKTYKLMAYYRAEARATRGSFTITQEMVAEAEKNNYTRPTEPKKPARRKPVSAED